jgi:uncharacterized protein
MQLSNQQTLPVTQQQAWEALNDISLLQAAIPGCESITPAGDNQYEVAIMAAVGPVKARFKGKLRLADLTPPTSYTMHFEGQGGGAGHGKGSAQVRLESAGARETVLHYTANASVGGKLAQVGSRLVDMAAQKMANDFFAAFNARLAERYAAPAAAAEPAPSSSVWARFAAWLKRLFGG